MSRGGEALGNEREGAKGRRLQGTTAVALAALVAALIDVDGALVRPWESAERYGLVEAVSLVARLQPDELEAWARHYAGDAP